MSEKADSEPRYVIDEESPGDCYARRLKPEHHYGVMDRQTGQHAEILPGVKCWAQDINTALDCLTALRAEDELTPDDILTTTQNGPIA